MRVVLREAAHAHQAVQRAGKLVPVHQAQFAHAHGQFAVAPHLALEGQDAARAVHGLDGVILAVDHGGVHIFAVMVPVAGLLPQRAVQDDGGFDLLVARLAVQIVPIVHQRVVDDHALGEEEREAGAFLHRVKQIQLAAQLAVVALFGLFQAGEVGVQLFAGFEGRAVDALEHLVLFAAAPVRAGHAHQLKGLHFAGARHVRAGAQVHKIALLIEGDRRVLGQIADELYLVGLALFLHKADGFLAGQLEALQLEVLLDDVLHFLFDGGEEFLGEGLVNVEIVVKAVFNRGADGQLGLGAQLFHGLGHDVAGRVAQRGKAVVKMRMFLHGDPSFLVLGKF